MMIILTTGLLPHDLEVSKARTIVAPPFRGKEEQPARSDEVRDSEGRKEGGTKEDGAVKHEDGLEIKWSVKRVLGGERGARENTTNRV